MVETKISLDRLQGFLQTDEIDTSYIIQAQMRDTALAITEGNFTWGEDSKPEEEADNAKKKQTKKESEKQGNQNTQQDLEMQS